MINRQWIKTIVCLRPGRNLHFYSYQSSVRHQVLITRLPHFLNDNILCVGRIKKVKANWQSSPLCSGIYRQKILGDIRLEGCGCSTIPFGTMCAFHRQLVGKTSPSWRQSICFLGRAPKDFGLIVSTPALHQTKSLKMLDIFSLKKKTNLTQLVLTGWFKFASYPFLIHIDLICRGCMGEVHHQCCVVSPPLFSYGQVCPIPQEATFAGDEWLHVDRD